MIELERTFLARHLPADLRKYPSREILDVYLPASSEHPVLRLRKDGDRYELTKKEPVEGRDSSRQTEQTITLTREEWDELNTLEGKRVRKRRYDYEWRGHSVEFDVFLDELYGLVVVDVEFSSQEAQTSFQIPDFCLVDITQEKFIAGGMLCAKTYADIESELDRFGYEPLYMDGSSK